MLISSPQNLGIVCSPTYVSTNNVQGVCAFFDGSSAEPVTAVHVQHKLEAAVSFARSLLRSNREQGFFMFDISIQHSITIVQSLREEASNQVVALRAPDHLEESTLALAESIFRDLMQSVQGDASPFHSDLEGRIALVGALFEAADSAIGLRR